MFDLKKTFKQAHLPQADWLGIREVRETDTTYSARSGKPEETSLNVTHGVMLEALVNGQLGYAATQDLSVSGIEKAAERAATLAKLASLHKVFSFSKSQRPAVFGRYRTQIQKPASAISAGDTAHKLTQLTRQMKCHPLIVDTRSYLVFVEIETRMLSQDGRDIEQSFSLVSFHLSATAQEGTLVQSRSNSGFSAHSYQGGWETLEKRSLFDQGETLSRQALELLRADVCPNETCSLVLMPDQMMLQIHESVGHPLELDRILGDERNYAGSSFVKPSDFGSLEYGSAHMNITFDPTLTHEFASYGFDDSGNPAQREFLIKNGILLRALGGLESQARSSVPGVANFRARSWNRAPIDRMANINLEPGTSSYDEILGSIERGVLMESNVSWSIDDYRDKFQFGCEYAKLIENGRITKTLRNPNYRGRTLSMWRNLRMVGDAQTFAHYGAPTCGKGEPNQVIWVGHGSPVCRFDNVEVFGGA